MKISTILGTAAELIASISYREFICHAIRATRGLPPLSEGDQHSDPAIKFLLDMGMVGDGSGFDRWRSNRGKLQIPFDVQRELRYTWLMFAYERAKEQGL
jgi:hypothetical protein